MTTQEIKDLVAAKIAGQGNQIDLGNAMPTIFGSIIEEIEDIKKEIDYDHACQQHLTIEIIEDDTQLSWLFPSGYDTSKAATIQWSPDNGLTWTSVTAANGEADGNIGTFNAGDKIIFRGSGATGFYDEDEGAVYGSFFHATKSCYVYGNVMSLLYGDNFASQREITQAYALALLFYDYSESYSGKWVLAKQDTPLILPATTLAESCYSSMFYGCASLAIAPALPATTLVDSCYSGMFGSCTSLIDAPELPATTLAESCYYCMFYGCTSLVIAPKLPATTLAPDCYRDMFSGCTALTSAPELPATTLADDCYVSMFYGCTSLVTAPELPATTLAQSCYDQMFYSCTSLVTAPELPATVLAQNCYSSMFAGCTALTSAPELPATTLVDSCYSGMFSSCTSLIDAPELPATTLAASCYSSMFLNCTSLSSVKCLAADVTPSGVVYNWLNGVAATGTFTKAAGVSWPSGASGIPSGWEVVEA